MKKYTTGVTLIELLIVLVIVGLLASMSYASYQEHIINAQRANAQSALKNLALALEDYRSAQFSYSGAAEDGSGGAADSGPPRIYDKTIPSDGSTAIFDLHVSVTDEGHFYVISAIPKANTISEGTGNMQLLANGAEFWDRNNDGDFDDICESSWKLNCE